MPDTMIEVDKSLATAVARIKAIEGVRKVVPGAYSQKRHQHSPGEIKVVSDGGGLGGSMSIRIFGTKGMQNVHVYADNKPLVKQTLDKPAPVVVETKPEKPQPKSLKVVAGPDARVSRVGRQQPVYPAEPAPIKPAQPVEDGVSGRLVSVTPEIAANWLERNTKNRPLRQRDVDKYAADMKAGRWMAGGSVIKFDRDGNIINGQHVLWAVLTSGVTVPVYVMSGLDPNVFMVEDDHARRSLGDVIRIRDHGAAVSNQQTSTANFLRTTIEWSAGRIGGSNLNLTRQEQIDFLTKHRDAIAFADRAVGGSTGTRRGIRIASVMAVIARAYYTEDHEKIRRFCHVLTTGIVDDTKENTAIVLRNWLQAAVGLSSASSVVKQDTYRRTERALRAFLDGEQLRIVKPVQDELFPLPEEPKRRAKRRTEG